MSPPAAITDVTSSPNRAKSAERILGAMRYMIRLAGEDAALYRFRPCCFTGRSRQKNTVARVSVRCEFRNSYNCSLLVIGIPIAFARQCPPDNEQEKDEREYSLQNQPDHE